MLICKINCFCLYEIVDFVCICLLDDCTYIFFAVRHKIGFTADLHFFFKEQLQSPADHGGLVFFCTDLMQFQHFFTSLCLDCFCKLSVHGCSFGSLSSGIFEDMCLIEMNIFYKFIRIFEIFLCLHREAYDHICCQCRCRVKSADQLTFLCIFRCAVSAVHVLEGLVTAALQGKVEMRAYLRKSGDPLHEFFRDDTWFQ